MWERGGSILFSNKKGINLLDNLMVEGDAGGIPQPKAVVRSKDINFPAVQEKTLENCIESESMA